jgi:hypothetical protein
MIFKKYQPSEQEVLREEKALTPEEETQSTEREKSFIVPENIAYNEGSGTLLLSLGEEAAGAEEIRPAAEQNGFEEKNEFHITVVGFRNAAEIRKALKKFSSLERQEKIDAIGALIKDTDWKFVPEARAFRIAKEYKNPDPKHKGAEVTEHRESYIRMVHLPAMERFYGELSNILGADIRPQPPHITLFTAGTDKEKAKGGIGINTKEELKKLIQEEISV